MVDFVVPKILLIFLQQIFFVFFQQMFSLYHKTALFNDMHNYFLEFLNEDIIDSLN